MISMMQESFSEIRDTRQQAQVRHRKEDYCRKRRLCAQPQGESADAPWIRGSLFQGCVGSSTGVSGNDLIRNRWQGTRKNRKKNVLSVLGLVRIGECRRLVRLVGLWHGSLSGCRGWSRALRDTLCDYLTEKCGALCACMEKALGYWEWSPLLFGCILQRRPFPHQSRPCPRKSGSGSAFCAFRIKATPRTQESFRQAQKKNLCLSHKYPLPHDDVFSSVIVRQELWN